MPNGESKIEFGDYIEELAVLKNTHKVWERNFKEKNITKILNLIDNGDLPKDWADTNGQTAAHLYLSTTQPNNIDKEIFNNLVTDVNLTKKHNGNDLLQIALNTGHQDIAEDLKKKLIDQGKFTEANYKQPATAKKTPLSTNKRYHLSQVAPFDSRQLVPDRTPTRPSSSTIRLDDHSR